MLTAVDAIGKPQTRRIRILSLVDNGAGPAVERFFWMKALARRVP